MADAASPSGSCQINIRLQFVEVDRHGTLDLGIDWDRSENGDGIAFGLLSDEVSADAGFDKFLEALEQEGKIDILAAPNLMSTEGEPASFLVGGEAPVSVPMNGSGEVEYKPFGISIEFLPTLLSDDRIGVRSRLEITSINPGDVASNDIRFSSFSTHMAEATFDLASGQSFAVSGLLDRGQSSDFAGLPYIPIIGSLINSERFQREETELIILVTAHSIS